MSTWYARVVCSLELLRGELSRGYTGRLSSIFQSSASSKRIGRLAERDSKSGPRKGTKILSNSQWTGFEPVRAEPNWFRVNRLNHSATTALDDSPATNCFFYSCSSGWVYQYIFPRVHKNILALASAVVPFSVCDVFWHILLLTVSILPTFPKCRSLFLSHCKPRSLCMSSPLSLTLMAFSIYYYRKRFLYCAWVTFQREFYWPKVSVRIKCKGGEERKRCRDRERDVSASTPSSVWKKLGCVRAFSRRTRNLCVVWGAFWGRVWLRCEVRVIKR